MVFGAVLLGFSVSAFEFTCTGQVYFPTIVFVLSDPGMRISAISHLFLYNLAFIIPLLSVFTLFYLGTDEKNFGLFLKERGPVVKLFTSIFFILLGMVMILNLP